MSAHTQASCSSAEPMLAPCSCLPERAATPATQRLRQRSARFRPFSSILRPESLVHAAATARPCSACRGRHVQRQFSRSSHRRENLVERNASKHHSSAAHDETQQDQRATTYLSRRAVMAAAAAIGMQAAAAEAKPPGKGASGDWSSPGLAAIEDDAAPRSRLPQALWMLAAVAACIAIVTSVLKLGCGRAGSSRRPAASRSRSCGWALGPRPSRATGGVAPLAVALNSSPVWLISTDELPSCEWTYLLVCHDARPSRRIMSPLHRVLMEYVLRRANGYFIYSTVEGVRPHRGSASRPGC